ncbi:probable E3 ubiquitin-protein ligase bre1 isoform X2 [Myripristis murdjan]|uniref:probable E3 ubiquitin-protein ligase bre1 isoform X2 n=1 Tax=Myripristis murdjan TaxID=586833 RepID=UPI0011764823|nr:probable E3 ubiquitin-protein ligase bre1 isoform X2 [Myripristis murdjan]
MSRTQMLRVLVNQRLSAAVEEIFGLIERTIEEYQEEVSCSKEENVRQLELLNDICVPSHSLQMSRVQMLRVLVNQRLTAAVEETFGLIEETIEEYEEEFDRQRQLLDNIAKPEIQIRKADSPQFLVCKVEDFPEQQQQQQQQQHWSPSPDQEQPEPKHIKEEQQELWSSQEGEQLQGLEEVDIIPFTPVPVKSEKDEEKAPSSQPQALASSSTEPTKTEADGEDCGAPEAARDLDPDGDLEPTSDGQFFSSDFSDIDTEDSDDDCKETDEPHSGLDTLNSGEGPFGCIVCDITTCTSSSS